MFVLRFAFANLYIENCSKDISKTITASGLKFGQLVEYLVKFDFFSS